MSVYPIRSLGKDDNLIAEIFTERKVSDMSESINNWIKEQNDITIYDIQHSQSSTSDMFRVNYICIIFYKSNLKG